jgi:HEAT repeat protein
MRENLCQEGESMLSKVLRTLLIPLVGAAISNLTGCLCRTKAERTLRAMERSFEAFLRRSRDPAGPYFWDEENGWPKKLAKLGPAAIEPVVAYYKAYQHRPNAKGVVAGQALRALALMQKKESIPELMLFATDSWEGVSQMAIAGLRRMCGEEYLDDIVRLAEEGLPPDWHTNRVMLIELLGKFRDQRVQDILRGYLKAKDPVLRRGALRAIARSRDISYLPMIQGLLEKEADAYVKIAAAEAAAALGDRVGVEDLLRLLGPNHDRETIQRAICALVRLREKDAVPKLSGLLRHEDVWVREFANEGLKLMGTPEARRALEKAGPVPDVPRAVDHFKPVDIFTWM